MSRSRVLADLGGQSLATDAELSAAVATKASYVYSATAPASPSNGNLWMDISTATPKGKVWNGSEWKLFSGAGAADFSNTATGTYTDANGIAWKYVQFNASGTLNVTTAGEADLLIVSGGGGAGVNGGFVGGPGGGGAAYFTSTVMTAGAYTVTVGAGGGASAQGGFSGVKATGFTGLRMAFYGGGGGGASASGGGAGASGGGGSNTTGGPALLSKAFGGDGATWSGGGAGGDATANNLAGIGPGVSSDITGTAIIYGRGNFASPGYAPTANRGEGGQPSGGSGSSGVVIVRVKV